MRLPQERTVWLLAGFLAGSGALLTFGLFGVLRHGDHLIDMMVFYIAGEWISAGVVPYAHHETPAHLAAEGLYQRSYSYPPQFTPFTLLLASGSYAQAQVGIVVVNLAAAGLLAFATLALTRTSGPTTVRSETAIVFFVLASPFAAHVLWLGNTSLIVAAALVLAWLALTRNWPILCGICLGIASIKPQFVVLPLIWLLLLRQPLPVLVAAATAGVLTLPYAWQFGLLAPLTDWLAGVAAYREDSVNALGFSHIFGIDSLLYALGVEVTGIKSAVLAVLALVGLYRLRAQFDAVTTLALLQAASVLLLPIHDYDLVVLAPLLGAFVLALPPARGASGVAMTMAALAALACFYFPQRFLVGFDLPALLHWREVIVLAMTAWLVGLRLKSRPPLPATLRGRSDQIEPV